MINRKSILIFLTGIIIGLVLAPFANTTPKQAIIAPISFSMADTKDIILPIPEGEVLGAFSYFGKMIDEQPESLASENIAEKPALLSSQPIIETPKDVKPSNYYNYSGKITVAAIGDSMTDLMGQDLPYLKKYLQKYYPQAKFDLYNYGVGAENIEKGKERIKNEYTYKEKNYPSLLELNPDVVVIESFSYNPFSEKEGAMDRHWLALTQIVDFIKNSSSAKIIVLATIAPAKEQFGQGPNGVNWPKDLAWQHAEKINQYLENTVSFAKSSGLPLVDVYHQTLLSNGEGNPGLINSGDHIHQNANGNELISQLLAEKIYSLKLF